MNTSHSESISLLIDLIQRESVTPQDKGCQALIGNRLQSIGFTLEQINSQDVTNLWARHGTESPLLVFAGHTDVVPTGDVNAWSRPPFAADIVDDHIIGRGAADMKGGVAAMITAMERFITKAPDHVGSIALILTSDEEGPATDGTAKVIEELQRQAIAIDYCVIGEPTSSDVLGDIMRNGRRGSLGATLMIHGTQGHVAYPHLAINPVHKAMPALSELCGIEWDQGDEYFPPTTLQISNIHAGTGATNVIPGTLTVEFNLRYSPATSIDHIKETIENLCKRHSLDVSLDWHDSAHPFLTKTGTLTTALHNAIRQHTGVNAILDTGGGTSDGRFIAPTGAQVIEFGPINASIHQVDERVRIEDIDTLSLIYENIMDQLLSA